MNFNGICFQTFFQYWSKQYWKKARIIMYRKTHNKTPKLNILKFITHPHTHPSQRKKQLLRAHSHIDVVKELPALPYWLAGCNNIYRGSQLSFAGKGIPFPPVLKACVTECAEWIKYLWSTVVSMGHDWLFFRRTVYVKVANSKDVQRRRYFITQNYRWENGFPNKETGTYSKVRKSHVACLYYHVVEQNFPSQTQVLAHQLPRCVVEW